MPTEQEIQHAIDAFVEVLNHQPPPRDNGGVIHWATHCKNVGVKQMRQDMAFSGDEGGNLINRTFESILDHSCGNDVNHWRCHLGSNGYKKMRHDVAYSQEGTGRARNAVLDILNPARHTDHFFNLANAWLEEYGYSGMCNKLNGVMEAERREQEDQQRKQAERQRRQQELKEEERTRELIHQVREAISDILGNQHCVDDIINPAVNILRHQGREQLRAHLSTTEAGRARVSNLQNRLINREEAIDHWQSRLAALGYAAMCNELIQSELVSQLIREQFQYYRHGNLRDGDFPGYRQYLQQHGYDALNNYIKTNTKLEGYIGSGISIIREIITRNEINVSQFRMSESGNTLLQEAIVRNNQALALAILDDTAFFEQLPINHRNNSGQTALHLAALRGNVKIAWHLILIGASVTIEDHNGCLISNIVPSSVDDDVKYLFRNFQNHPDQVRQTHAGSFFRLCESNSVDELQSHIRQFDINLIDSNGESGLIKAARAGHLEMVNYLLDHGLNLRMHAFKAIDAVRSEQYAIRMSIIQKLAAINLLGVISPGHPVLQEYENNCREQERVQRESHRLQMEQAEERMKAMEENMSRLINNGMALMDAQNERAQRFQAVVNGLPAAIARATVGEFPQSPQAIENQESNEEKSYSGYSPSFHRA